MGTTSAMGTMGGADPVGGVNGLGSSSTGMTGSASTTQFGRDSTATAADAQSRVDAMGNPAHDTVERLSNAAHQTVDKLAGSAASVADRFSDQARWMSETPPRMLASSKSWIQEKPLEAVGIAVAVGYLMGRMRH